MPSVSPSRKPRTSAVNKLYATMSPDELAFTRRMLALAESAPADPAARDALVWVLNKPGMFDQEAYGDEFARAAALLVRHHGDDPEAVRVGLVLENITSFHRDAFLLGLYAAAKGRESEGLARLALAQYLQQKSLMAASVRQVQGRQKMRFLGYIDDDGKVGNKEVNQSDEQYAYWIHLRQCDAETLRAEAERLYSEVIADYGDVPFITLKHRELESLLKEPAPAWWGKPITDDDRTRIKEILAQINAGRTS